MSAAGADARRGLSRAVIWTGIALGTCLAILAMSDGAVLRVGGLPSWLGLFLGGVIVWALVVLAAVTLAELTRRHHRAAARYAVRQGRHHGGRLASAAGAWARERWQRRQAPGGAPEPPQAPPAAAMPPAAVSPAAEPPRRVCVSCGNPENGPRRDGGTWGPLVIHHDPDDGRDRLVHRAHFEDDTTGYYGEPYQPASTTETTGGNTMTGSKPASRINPARRAHGAAARAGGTMPAAWNAVIARTADFEPESDGDLLDWMVDEVAGVAAYAEALVDLYESLVQGAGLDPVAMAALHDVADAQAHASETMSGARRKFADHYDRPREFAAEGGLMPHDGRWVTGEGDA